jgi:hypothetical protein
MPAMLDCLPLDAGALAVEKGLNAIANLCIGVLPDGASGFVAQGAMLL